MEEATDCISRSLDCLPQTLFNAASVIERTLPAHINPVGGSVLLQMLITVTYEETLKWASKEAADEKAASAEANGQIHNMNRRQKPKHVRISLGKTIKEELRAKEKEEGKDKKKKLRGSYKKRIYGSAATAGEAIEKMLAEKKISTKINYDILKSLDQPGTPLPVTSGENKVNTETKPTTPSEPITPLETLAPSSPPKKRKKKPPPASPAPPSPATPAPATPSTPVLTDGGEDYDDDIEPEPTEAAGELSLAAMLQNGQDDDYYDYEDY